MGGRIVAIIIAAGTSAAAIGGGIVFYMLSQSPAPSVKTVKYYCDHESERRTQLAQCRNDPGGIGLSPNCINASQAQRSVEGTAAIKRLDQNIPPEYRGSPRPSNDPCD